MDRKQRLISEIIEKMDLSDKQIAALDDAPVSLLEVMLLAQQENELAYKEDTMSRSTDGNTGPTTWEQVPHGMSNDDHLYPYPLKTQHQAKTVGEGFEPPVPDGTTVFETAAFDRSANLPKHRKRKMSNKSKPARFIRYGGLLYERTTEEELGKMLGEGIGTSHSKERSKINDALKKSREMYKGDRHSKKKEKGINPDAGGALPGAPGPGNGGGDGGDGGGGNGGGNGG